MIGEIHVDDVGTVFRATVKDENDDPVNLIGSTVVFRFKLPDASILTKSATFVNDGSDGLVYYTIEEGDLSIHGRWEVQAFVDYGTVEWYSDVYKFKVYKNLGC